MPDVFASATLETAQANALASVKVQVQNLNNSLTAQYMTTFNNWALSVTAGRSPNTNPPQPPLGYTVGYFNDPTSGPGSLGPYGDVVVQWAYPMVGKTPVCDMPPIPVVPTHTIESGKIGIEDPTDPGWFTALAGDTTPGGKKVIGVSADGKQGLFLKWASPFGSHPETGEVGGWYQKIG